MQYADERGNLWGWLKDAPVGHKAMLRDGRVAAYNMARYYGRKIKIRTKGLRGDFEVEVLS